MSDRRVSEAVHSTLPPIPTEIVRSPTGVDSYALMMWAREVRAHYHRRMLRDGRARLWSLARSTASRLSRAAAERGTRRGGDAAAGERVAR